MSAATAQHQSTDVLQPQCEDPFAAAIAMEGIVPIPMPPLTHPGGELVHPWED